MVSQAGQYYGAPFKGYHGVTQGEPLSPTILNMLVNAVISNWVALMVWGGGITGRFWESGPSTSSAVIYRQWDPRLPFVRTYPGSFGNSDRAVRPGHI